MHPTSLRCSGVLGANHCGGAGAPGFGSRARADAIFIFEEKARVRPLRPAFLCAPASIGPRPQGEMSDAASKKIRIGEDRGPLPKVRGVSAAGPPF
jgi:hypothetical protein